MAGFVLCVLSPSVDNDPVAEPLSSHVSYDDLPYDGGCVSVSHPSRMRAIGRLFGLQAPEPTTARVLEIGCAGGSNLLPLAYALPGATFTGIDLSARQIELAASRVAELGLTNVQLESMSVTDAAILPGPYDYIICHGVYSWVPDDVRTAILDTIRDKLAPNGIAMVSYNALPGWHFRKGVRDMMVYHGRYFPTVEERAQQARALVDFVAEGGANLAAELAGLAISTQAVAAVREVIARYPDYYVVHEFLESDNRAFYLYEFVDQIEGHDLQYLGDTSLAAMVSGNLPPAIAETLERISVSAVALEQYRDFLVNRTFKHSLICSNAVHLRREIEPDVAREFAYRIASVPGAADETAETAYGADGRLISLVNPVGRAIVAALRAAYPRSLTFSDAKSACGAVKGDEMERILLNLLAHDIIEAVDGPLGREPSSTNGNPTAWQPARVFGTEMASVPTRYHQSLGVNGAGRSVLRLLDGSRTVDQVLDEAYALLAQPGVSFELEAGTIEGPDLPRELSDDIVQSLIEDFRKHGALES